MARTYPVLAPSEQIRTLIRRANAILGQLATEPGYSADPVAQRSRDAAYRAAKDAMRFASMAAGIAGDATLLSELIDIVDLQAHWDPDTIPHVDAVADALSLLLERGGPVDESIEKLAEHHQRCVREALATGISPKDPRSIAVLEKLVGDANPEVRKPAKAALATVREIPWWTGKFQRDPSSALSSEEVLLHQATLERISALVDARRPNEKLEELVSLVSTLPDPLAVDFAFTQLSAPNRYDNRLASLGSILVSREGGGDRLVRLCEAWSRVPYYQIRDDHLSMMKSAPEERRLTLCSTLARWALERSSEERADQQGAARLAADLAARAWPAGADLSSLLEGLLTLPPIDDTDWVSIALQGVFTSKDADPASILDRVIEARLLGYPNEWAPLGRRLDSLLEHAPREALRRAAERALESEDEALLTWGLSQLLLHAQDPEKDGSPLETARRLMEIPRYRAAILKDYDLRAVSVGLLRADLRACKLGFNDAMITVNMISKLWDPEGNSAPEHGRFAAFLGPEELHGPVTDDEWAILRRARGRELESEDFPWPHAVCTLPPGPLGAEDRGFIDAAIRRLEETGDADAPTAKGPLLPPLGQVLLSKPEEATLGIFDRLMERLPWAQRYLSYCKRELRKSLGLPGEAKAASALARDEEADEMNAWMDND